MSLWNTGFRCMDASYRIFFRPGNWGDHCCLGLFGPFFSGIALRPCGFGWLPLFLYGGTVEVVVNYRWLADADVAESFLVAARFVCARCCEL